MTDEHGQDTIPHCEWLIMFEKVVNEVKDDLKKQGREDEFVGAKVMHMSAQSCRTVLNLCVEDYLFDHSFR